MATVFLARDLKHGRDVAVKVLRPDLAASIGSDRFLREIEIAAQLTHPHILPLHDSGDSNGVLYYVMPYIAGESLRGLLLRHGTLSVEGALAIGREIAGALTYAHRRGVVHRDIKPENVLLAEGHAVVADFGIAKAISTAGAASFTRTGFPLGTPGYMSPEQAAGSTSLDETSDVFSLACVYYEMLIGETPGLFVSHEAQEMQRFVDAPATHRQRLDLLSGTLERCLVKAMSLRPRDRFATPDALIEAAALSGTGRRYSEAEMREIVGRAAQRDEYDEALTIGSIQRVAAEVGIPPRHILREASRLEPPTPRNRPLSVLGVEERVVLEHILPGEVSPDMYPEILEDIRHVMGEVGRINETMGSSLSWNSLSFQNSPSGIGRLTHVTVMAKRGETRIRVTEAPGQHGIVGGMAVVFAGFLGAAAGGSIAESLAITGLLSIPGAIGGAGAALAGLRFAMRQYIRHRIDALTNLVNRVAKQAIRSEHTPYDTPSADPVEINSNP
jgi:serine/threonine protein kinase